MTAPKDGKGNPLEESPEVARVRQALEEPPEAARVLQALEESLRVARGLQEMEEPAQMARRAELRILRSIESIERENQRRKQPPAPEPRGPDSGDRTAKPPGPKATDKRAAKERGADVKRAALESLLVEIDRRAAEQGAGFDRHSLPGTRLEFQSLLKAYCRDFDHIGFGTINGYLKGQTIFQSGVKPKQARGRAIWALFPEFAPKLESNRESKQGG